MFYEDVPSRRWCQRCDRDVTAAHFQPTAVMWMVHGIVTVCTCGMWLLPGAMMELLFSRTFVCPKCRARV